MLEFWNHSIYVQRVVIMERLMWHSSAISWKTAEGPQIKEREGLNEKKGRTK
jgi:hypothetical protein